MMRVLWLFEAAFAEAVFHLNGRKPKPAASYHLLPTFVPQLHRLLPAECPVICPLAQLSPPPLACPPASFFPGALLPGSLLPRRRAAAFTSLLARASVAQIRIRIWILPAAVLLRPRPPSSTSLLLLRGRPPPSSPRWPGCRPPPSTPPPKSLSSPSLPRATPPRSPSAPLPSTSRAAAELSPPPSSPARSGSPRRRRVLSSSLLSSVASPSSQLPVQIRRQLPLRLIQGSLRSK